MSGCPSSQSPITPASASMAGAHDLSSQSMWKKVQGLQNVTSCQISVESSVLIKIVFVREEEMTGGESNHVQSLVPRKEVFLTVLMLEENVKGHLAGSIRRECDS